MVKQLRRSAVAGGRRQPRAVLRSAIACLVVGLMIGVPATSGATPVLIGAKWPNGNYFISVNTSSFFNNFPNGLKLDTNQVRYWVPYALSSWREGTGIQNGLTFAYGTTTANHCHTFPHATNSSNDVAVYAGCAADNPDCSQAGRMWPRFNAGATLFLEADVCIYGADDPAIPGADYIDWKLAKAPLNGSDLIRTLRHEFGHALGLGHDTASDTVMTPGGPGGTPNRDLAGHDIRGMRMVYTPSSTATARWRQITGTGTTWGAESSVSAVDGVWGSSVAVGLSSPNNRVIATELKDDGTGISFNRANYPISAGSSWSEVSINFTGAATAWSPPAIAARPPGDLAGQLWVAAVKIQSNTNAVCQDLRIYRSTDAFTTQSVTTINDCNYPSPPHLTYDQGSGYYVLVNSSHSTGSIRFQTSLDGATWIPTTFGASAPIALDGADVACQGYSTFGTSNCMLTFATGDTSIPMLRNRKFSVNWLTGAVTLGATSGTDTVTTVDGIPAPGVRTVSGSANWTLVSPTAAGSGNDRTNGRHMLVSAASTSNPITSFSWGVVGTGTTFDYHRPDVASEPLSDRMYLWYVQ